MPFNSEQDSYRRLRNVIGERTSRIIFWIGAGLSVPAGLPSWSGLRKALSEELVRKAKTYVDDDAAQLLLHERDIAAVPNAWQAFQQLEAALGQATFAAAVRGALSPAPMVPTPRAFSTLWALRPAGIVSLNLDRLVTRAFHEREPSASLVEFTSAGVGNHARVLQGLQPFVYNAHGVSDDHSSWVFSADKLTALLANPAYVQFVAASLVAYVNVFIGLSADDVAVGGHLERLGAIGVKSGTHYWISSRRDKETDSWAQGVGIEMIRYQEDAGHTQLQELLDDLVAFLPSDTAEHPVPVVLDAAGHDGSLPTPAELVMLDAEEVRYRLNAHAKALIADESADALRRFEEFIAEYDEALHRAWYITDRPGKNMLLGYTIEREWAKGAFGHVYKAYSQYGSPVAIKVLHSNLRHERPLLLAFRRGVKSMSILRSHGVPGIATYIEASELPPFVAMDWIDGANLSEAVKAKKLQSWPHVLRAAIGLTDTIAAAHAVPERVLHRDIRPANVMLDGFWTTDDWKVVVLDFDLSWHRGAFEQSVIHGSGTAGYLAPEQITSRKDASTRHAAVDSFGVGMTLYFVVGGIDPVPNQHLHTGWRRAVAEGCARLDKSPWRSTASRMARLIIMSTADRQADRPDIGQIRNELVRLADAQRSDARVEGTDMLAEEIATRCAYFANYEWDIVQNRAVVRRPSGLELTLIADESRRVVEFQLQWSSAGTDDWKQLVRWLPEASKSASGSLSKSGWNVSLTSPSDQRLTVVASVPADLAATKLSALAQSIDTAIKHLNLGQLYH